MLQVLCPKCGQSIDSDSETNVWTSISDVSVEIVDEVMIPGSVSELAIVLPNSETRYPIKNLLFAKAFRNLIKPEIPAWKKDRALILRKAFYHDGILQEEFDYWDKESQEKWLRVVDAEGDTE